MGRKLGQVALSPGVVADVLSGVVGGLCGRHPAVREELITEVVQQAAGELVTTVTDSHELTRMLRTRANARLAALTGAPVALSRSGRAGFGPGRPASG